MVRIIINRNLLKCFIPRSCWILRSDWSERADQFSDSESNNSRHRRWLFSVRWSVLFLTGVMWIVPFRHFTQVQKKSVTTKNGFPEKRKRHRYRKGSVNTEHMTRKCNWVIILKSGLSMQVTAAMVHHEKGVGGETCRIRVFSLYIFKETGFQDKVHIGLFLLFKKYVHGIYKPNDCSNWIWSDQQD